MNSRTRSSIRATDDVDGNGAARRRFIATAAHTLAVLISCALGVIALIHANRAPRIGYIRSGELLSRFVGMKEAENLIQERQKQREADMDTLRNDYRRALNTYNVEFARYSESERTKHEELLRKQEDNLRRYSYAAADKSSEEGENIMQGVLNQINDAAQRYGKEHGFDIILGTTQSGNILHGNDALDITDEILTALNTSYKPNSLHADSSTR